MFDNAHADPFTVLEIGLLLIILYPLVSDRRSLLYLPQWTSADCYSMQFRVGCASGKRRLVPGVAGLDAVEILLDGTLD